MKLELSKEAVWFLHHVLINTDFLPLDAFPPKGPNPGIVPWKAEGDKQRKKLRRLKHWFNTKVCPPKEEKTDDKPRFEYTPCEYEGALRNDYAELVVEILDYYQSIGNLVTHVDAYEQLFAAFKGEDGELEPLETKGKSVQLTQDAVHFLHDILVSTRNLPFRAIESGGNGLGIYPWLAKDRTQRKMIRRLQKWYRSEVCEPIETASGQQRYLKFQKYSGELPEEYIDLLVGMLDHYEVIGNLTTHVDLYQDLVDGLKDESMDFDEEDLEDDSEDEVEEKEEKGKEEKVQAPENEPVTAK